MEYIDAPSKYGNALKKLGEATYLCIDGEFTAYNEKISVLSIKSDAGDYIFDCLKTNARKIIPLLCNGKILKIFHAGLNDIRMIRRFQSFQPVNIFDTQIAATFIGSIGAQSLENLIYKYLGSEIPKTHSISDWSKRPLTSEQLNYAFQDVEYLFSLRNRMASELEKVHRTEWLNEETNNIYSDVYTKQAEKIKYYNNINVLKKERNKVFLMRLFKWRTEEAKRRNMEEELFFGAKSLIDLAKNTGDDPNIIRENQHLPKRIKREFSDALVELYTEPTTEAEKVELGKIPTPKRNNEITSMQSLLLKSYINYTAQEMKIDPQLLFPSREIDSILKYGFNIPTKFKTTWRKRVISDHFIDLLSNDVDINYDIYEDSMKITIAKAKDSV